MPKASRIDEAQLRALHAEGLSGNAIAKRLNAPRTTVANQMQRLGLKLHPAPSPQIRPQDVDSRGIHERPQDVHISLPAEQLPTLQEVLAWWRARREGLVEGANRTRTRFTIYLEEGLIEAVKQRAEHDGTSITEVMNTAVRLYLQGAST